MREEEGDLTITAEHHHDHDEAFGEQSAISEQIRIAINSIRANDSTKKSFYLSPHDTTQFTTLTWKLLSQYIATNKHLRIIGLINCLPHDRNVDATNNISQLFDALTKSTSLRRLSLLRNELDADGVHSMVSFLRDSPHLAELSLSHNTINGGCLDMLLSALHESSTMKFLRFSYCSIDDISSLSTYTLPNLRTLNLQGNKIGNAGCIIISNLLRKPDTKLISLELSGMGDAEAVMLANSLKNNTTLTSLRLLDSDTIIDDVGCYAFLKLLIDISSIEHTCYKSNHTLTMLGLPYSKKKRTNLIQMWINYACTDNDNNISYNNNNENTTTTTNAHAGGAAAARDKVIRSQMISKNRKKLCRLQGVEYSYLLEGVGANVLTRVLALIGENHGQREVFAAFVQMAPELLSFR